MDLAKFRIPMNEIYSSIVSLWKIVVSRVRRINNRNVVERSNHHLSRIKMIDDHFGNSSIKEKYPRYPLPFQSNPFPPSIR